ncbi:MAG: hypothetical protein UT72_C0014G0006 [Candidatus Woesebacteria bacterium GW2011_GWB1_40_101]|uniref:Uncharacterized protein n=1 Tax=Candidatus Woesebacteria bacterium GW2011_GWB1_40_101 TaxID=1618575 RepID=A0A0G0QPA1_9BACT|nr:MAG: hypothetical protein UT72_C0014G0006 [Candidatus Woesebacteria bacterium GW2011_GWB1_40_101]
MAKGARKHQDVYLAPKIGKEALKNLQGLLILVGKPFYLLLSYLVIALLFVFYLVGHLARTIAASVIRPKIKIELLWLKIKLLPIKLTVGIKNPLPEFKLKLRFGLIAPLFLLALSFFTFWYIILRNLPSPDKLITKEEEISTKIYDRNGVLLYKIYKNKNRTPVSLEKIPIQVRLATLAAEDAEFYSHPGFSIKGILRALLKNLKEGEVNGGSTITQQLVKNALLTPEKTLSRKIKEIILAIEVELTYSKDQILEMYLNEVSYGGTAYGIQEAAQYYFGKDVGKLSLAEAAYLAGLPKSPTKFSPFGETPETGIGRQKDVIRLMTVNKFITQEIKEGAEGEKLTFASPKIDIKAPHFVMYVKNQLVEKYGEEVVEKGGLEVVTTLDYPIQEMAEGVVKSEVEKLKSLRVGNGAALVLNSKTGEILAMVGSKDYFDQKNDGNVNVTTSLRQPGSSIKIINYAYALSHGLTPSSILSDSPVTFSVAGQPPYIPKNYDSEYRGNITLRSALAESRNIPAVKVLASYGVVNMIELGRKMGITTWTNPSDYGLSLTLGGGDVRLIDLSQVYSVIANYGKRPEVTSILKVTNFQGKVLEKACTDCENEQVIDPRVAYLLIDILKDNAARTPSFGSSSQLVIPKHPEVAVKTGTSNNLRDNLTLGFNQKYLVAVWVGNNDNSPMSHIASGITGAAPIFNNIVKHLLASEEAINWEIPEGLAHIQICPLTGTLACKSCSGKFEWFLKESVPKASCSESQIAQIVEEKAKKESQILDSGAFTSNP